MTDITEQARSEAHWLLQSWAVLIETHPSDFDAIAQNLLTDTKKFLSAKHAQSPSVPPETVVYNIAQRDPHYRKWLIEQLTALGDQQDREPLRQIQLVSVTECIEEFTQAAIEAHVGFNHPRQWEDCDGLLDENCALCLTSDICCCCKLFDTPARTHSPAQAEWLRERMKEFVAEETYRADPTVELPLLRMHLQWFTEWLERKQQ